MPLTAVLHSSLSADQTLDASVVLYRDHRLTPLATADGTFSCRVQEPRTGTILTTIAGCSSAGQALVHGQYWVMHSLGVSVDHPDLRTRTLRRSHRRTA